MDFAAADKQGKSRAQQVGQFPEVGQQNYTAVRKAKTGRHETALELKKRVRPLHQPQGQQVHQIAASAVLCAQRIRSVSEKQHGFLRHPPLLIGQHASAVSIFADGDTSAATEKRLNLAQRAEHNGLQEI